MSAADPAHVDEEPEYLDVAGAAARLGVKPTGIQGRLERGTFPEPDLVWYGVDLWLVETVERVAKRKKRLHGATPRAGRVRTANRTTGRPPKVNPPAGLSSIAAAPNRRLGKKATRALGGVAAALVAEPVARELAAALRAEGHYATTEDVLDLSASEPLGNRERELLRQRVVAKVRALKAREH